MEVGAGVYGKRKKRGRSLQGNGNWDKFNRRKNYKTLRNILQYVEANEKGNLTCLWTAHGSHLSLVFVTHRSKYEDFSNTIERRRLRGARSNSF